MDDDDPKPDTRDRNTSEEKRAAAGRKISQTLRSKGVKVTVPPMPWEDPEV